MTLGEGKEKVYMLLDEHSAGGTVEHDPDLELKMVRFFDTAQKMLAQVRKIVKTRRIVPRPGQTEYAMPPDFRNLYRIWRDGVPATRRYHWRRARLVVPPGDGAQEILVEYFAYAPDIPPDAGDDYEFELAPDAAECMPFYVAAQHLLPDPVLDYDAMLRLYREAVDRLDPSLPDDDRRVAQRLFS